MFYQHYLANRKFGFVWGLYIICVGKKIFYIVELFQSNISSFVSGLTRQNCLGKLEAECQGGAQEEVCQDRKHQHQRAQQLPRHSPQTSGPDPRGTGLENNLKLFTVGLFAIMFLK